MSKTNKTGWKKTNEEVRMMLEMRAAMQGWKPVAKLARDRIVRAQIAQAEAELFG